MIMYVTSFCDKPKNVVALSTETELKVPTGRDFCISCNSPVICYLSVAHSPIFTNAFNLDIYTERLK